MYPIPTPPFLGASTFTQDMLLLLF
jgi:hypothetical protein